MRTRIVKGLEDAELASLWILKDGPRLAVLFHVPEADPAELHQAFNLGVAIGTATKPGGATAAYPSACGHAARGPRR
jgi:hypothetical protein